MTVRLITFAFDGVDPRPVDVQVQLSAGMPYFAIVGLPDKAVGESRERVRAAFASLGLALPPQRIVVNLAPADLPKEGSHFDLPIAIALMAAIGALPKDCVEGIAAIGELSLDGRLAPVSGALPAAVCAHELGLVLVCPDSVGAEAAWGGGQVLAPAGLMALVNHFKGSQVLGFAKPGALQAGPSYPDLADVRGQERAKRALEIAAAGGHNLMMVGPPGSGKSMLAQRLPGLLPDLAPAELLEVSMIASVAGQIERGGLVRSRPFRAPHHSASMAAMVGGGVRAKPGEISLAHRGVLFLDELPEFHPQVLDALRQPLETNEVTIARANRHVSYPAAVQIVAAMNPCRCGSGDAASCRRWPKCAQEYQGRLSGPFLDRIDLFVDVQRVTARDLGLPPAKEGTEIVRARVAAARAVQAQRYTRPSTGKAAIRSGQISANDLNAHAHGPVLDSTAKLDADAKALLTEAAEKLQLTARGYHRSIKVARTIADLAEAPTIARKHIAEALSYRRIANG